MQNTFCGITPCLNNSKCSHTCICQEKSPGRLWNTVTVVKLKKSFIFFSVFSCSSYWCIFAVYNIRLCLQKVFKSMYYNFPTVLEHSKLKINFKIWGCHWGLNVYFALAKKYLCFPYWHFNLWELTKAWAHTYTLLSSCFSKNCWASFSLFGFKVMVCQLLLFRFISVKIVWVNLSLDLRKSFSH